MQATNYYSTIYLKSQIKKNTIKTNILLLFYILHKNYFLILKSIYLATTARQYRYICDLLVSNFVTGTTTRINIDTTHNSINL